MPWCRSASSSFRLLLLSSLCASLLQAILQLHCPSIRYRSFGARPLGAVIFIGAQVLLLMSFVTVGFGEWSKDSSNEDYNPLSSAPHKSHAGCIVGIFAAVAAWCIATFML